jgi:protein MAK11
MVADQTEAEQVKFSPLGTHFAVLFPKKIEIYSLSLNLLNTLETKSRYNSLLFAEVDLDGLPVEVLCVGTEKGVVEVYDVDIVDVEESEDEKDVAEEEEEEEEKDEKLTQVAEVERIGTLVGHTNRSVFSLFPREYADTYRVKSISAISHTIPANPPLATTLLTTASSDGFVNLYDLTQVFGATDKAEENAIEPVGRYDTKGSRLTCVFLADGRRERVVEGVTASEANGAPAAVNAEEAADEDDAADESGDEDMYDSAQEEGDEEELEEEEEEEEEEDEEEAEYE